MVNLTEKIRMEMARLELTQAEIASRTGLSPNTVSAIYNGKDTRISTMETFADVLGFRLDLTPKTQPEPAGAPATT